MGGHAKGRLNVAATSSDNGDILDQTIKWRSQGKGVAVDYRGAFIGSLWGGCVYGSVIVEGLGSIKDGKPRLLDFGVTNEQAWEVGLACGGKIQVFVERVE